MDLTYPIKERSSQVGKGAFRAAFGENATGDAQQNSVKDANKGRSKREVRKNKRKAAELEENSE